eukprot:384055_1
MCMDIQRIINHSKLNHKPICNEWFLRFNAFNGQQNRQFGSISTSTHHYPNAKWRKKLVQWICGEIRRSCNAIQSIIGGRLKVWWALFIVRLCINLKLNHF